MAFPLFFAITSFYFLFNMQGVACHGYVSSVEVDGKSYPGYNPNTDPYDPSSPTRFTRKVPGDGPVDVTSTGLACNTGGEEGTHTGVVNIAAGSQITFQWTKWPSDHEGPVTTYMTSCDGSCTNFSVVGAKWFNVDGGGYNSGNKTWATDQLISNNNSWSSTIPPQLKAGQYLVRNEIVALHNTDQAQHFPSCAQVQVTGSGTGIPSASDLVDLQDTYPPKWPDIWADGFDSFTLGGPGPVTFSKSAGAGTTSRPSAGTPTSAPSTMASGISNGHQPPSASVTAPSHKTQCPSQRRRHIRRSIEWSSYYS